MKKIKEKVKKTKTGKLSIYIYRRFFERRPLVLLFSFAFLLNLVTLFVVSFVGRSEEGIIPLHYVIGQGVDKTGPWYFIYSIPGFLFLMTVMNFIIAKFLKVREEIFVSYFIVGATMLAQVIGLLAAFLIISIV